MSREAGVVAALGLTVLVVALVAAGGFAGGRVTTEVSEQEQPDAATGGVIYLLREEPRTRILGFEFGVRRSIGVSFLVDPQCAEALVGAERWPPAGSGCTDDLDLAGAIERTGRSLDGLDSVGVVFQVDRRCFDGVAVGTRWIDVRTLCSA